MEYSIRGTPITVTAGMVLLLLGSLALMGYGGYDYAQQSSAVEDAVTVEATVVEASVSESGGRRSTSYSAEVTFTYEHRGKEYTSDRLYPGAISPSYDGRSAAESATEPYEPGTAVTAYVDPEAPGEGFLIRRTSGGPVRFVAIGTVGVVVMVLRAVGARTPGQGTEFRPPSEAEPKRYRTLFGVDRGTVYRASVWSMIAGAIAVPLSLVGVAVLLLGARVGAGEPVDLTVGATDPIGMLLVAAALGAAVLTAGVGLYALWSFTEYRRLRDRIPEQRPPSPFRHPTRLVTMLFGNHELDSYGQRVKKTGFALVVLAFLVGTAVRIVF